MILWYIKINYLIYEKNSHLFNRTRTIIGIKKDGIILHYQNILLKLHSFIKNLIVLGGINILKILIIY